MNDRTVALDARFLAGDRKGIGRYLHNLLTGMEGVSNAPSFALLSDAPLSAAYGNLRVVTVEFRSWSSYSWEQWKLPRALRKVKADVFHAVGNALPASPPHRTVLTLHDAMMFGHPLLGREANRYYWYQTQVLRLAAKKCAAIITVSQTSALEIQRRLGRSVASLLRVIPNAVDAVFFQAVEEGDLRAFRRRHNLPGEYILHLGATLPRKNTRMLIAAHSLARAPAPLVIGGLAAGDFAAVAEWVPDGADVRLVRYLPPEEHALLVAGALALALPSRDEGFGMPALEAMAAGVPVVASDAGAIPEVCGRAAMLVPLEVAAFAEALDTISSDGALRSRLREAGRDRARLFSSREMATATLDVYREVWE